MDSIVGWIFALTMCVCGGVWFFRQVLADYENYLRCRRNGWEV